MAKPLANVTAFFQLIWGQLLIVASAVGSFFANLFGFLLANLQWIFLFAFLIALGIIWTKGGSDEVLEAAEYSWRCIIYPFVEFFLFLLEPLADLFDAVICWWNALSLWNRLVSRRIITGVLRQCSAFSYRDFFFRLADAAKVLSTSLNWVTLNFGTGPFPFYPIICELLGAASQLGNLVICICANIRVVGDVLRRILVANEICCAIHHALNGLLYTIQSNIAWGYQALVNFVQLLTLDPSGFQALADAFLSGTGPYAAVPIFPLTERLAATAANVAQFGNHLVGVVACSIVAEVETGGFQPDFAGLAFEACMTEKGTVARSVTCSAWVAEDPAASAAACLDRATVRINLFGWVGAVIEAFVRLLAAVYQLVSNSGRVLNEFLTLPPGDRFATEVWQLDAVWDTLRVPPVQLGGAAASKINVMTNPFVYGNLTQLNEASGIPTCNATDTPSDADPIGCAECLVRPRAFEEHWCQLWRQVDDALEPVFIVRIFEPLLCCVPISVLRTVIGFAKWLLDFIVHYLAGVDRLAAYVANSTAWSTPWTELAGLPTEEGGVLRCLCALFAIEPNNTLRCLCVIIAFPLKSALEVVRVVVLFVPAIVNAILEASGSPLYDAGQPTVLEQLCIAGTTGRPFCIDLEGRLLKWWRAPRDRTTLFQNVSIPIQGGGPVNGTLPVLQYLPINTTQSPPVVLVSSAVGSPNPSNPGTGTGVLYDPATGEMVVYRSTVIFSLLDIVETIVDDTLIPLPGSNIKAPSAFLPGKIILEDGVPLVVNETWIYVVEYDAMDNVRINVTRVPQDNWVDCLCFVISIEFVNQYLDAPIDGSVFPDICCAIRFSARIVVELIKTLLEFVLGIVTTVVALFDGDPETDPLVLLAWLSCDPELELCSPIVEAISDLQDLLGCPCLIIDAIQIGNVSGIPCVCAAVNAFIIGLIELLFSLITLGKAILASAKCIFYEPTDANDETCGVLLIERYKQFLRAIVASLDQFSASFGSVGCLIGILFPLGCIDEQTNPQTCLQVLQLGLIYETADTCEGPNPSTDGGGGGGASYGPPGSEVVCGCSPLLRFRRLFERVFDTVALIIIVPIEFLITLVELIQAFAATSSSGNVNVGGLLVDFLQLLAIEVMQRLVGDPDSHGPQAFGLVQTIGLVFNCLLGPANCDNNSGMICAGDIFIAAGNALRDIIGCIIGTEVYDPSVDSYGGDILFMPFRTLFAIIGGSGENPTVFIEFFVSGLFCLVEQFFNVVSTIILPLIEGLISGILCFILGGIIDCDALQTFVGFFFGIFDLVINFFSILGCIFTQAQNIAQVGNCIFCQKPTPCDDDDDDKKRAFMDVAATMRDSVPEDMRNLFFFDRKTAEQLFGDPVAFSGTHMEEGALCTRVLRDYGSIALEQQTPEQTTLLRLCQTGALLPHLVNERIMRGAFPFLRQLREHEEEHQRRKRRARHDYDGDDTAGPADSPQLPLIPIDLLHNTTRMRSYMQDLRPALEALRMWQSGHLVLPTDPRNGQPATRTVMITDQDDEEEAYHCPSAPTTTTTTTTTHSEGKEGREHEDGSGSGSGSGSGGGGGAGGGSMSSRHEDACTFQPKELYVNVTLAEFFEKRGLGESAVAHQMIGAQHLFALQEAESRRMELASFIHRTVEMLSPNDMRRTFRHMLHDMKSTSWKRTSAAIRETLHQQQYLSNDQRALPSGPVSSMDASQTDNNNNNNSSSSLSLRIPLFGNRRSALLHLLPAPPPGHVSWSGLVRAVLAGMWRRHVEQHPVRRYVSLARLWEAIVDWQARHTTARSSHPSFVEQQVGGLIAMHRRIADVTGSERMYTQANTLASWWQAHTLRVQTRLDQAAQDQAAQRRAGLDQAAQRRAGRSTQQSFHTNITTTTTTTSSTTMVRKREVAQFNPPWPRCNASAPGDPCFDCAILEEFLNETVGLFSFCVERSQGLGSPIQFEPTGDLTLEVVPIGEQAPLVSGEGLLTDLANALISLVNALIGFDLVATLFNLLTNFNTDPSEGPVGIYAFLPYVTRCDRELHLQCTYGLGVGPALSMTVSVVLITPLILSFVFPPLGTLFMTIVSLFGLWRVFLVFFAFLAWGYNPNCFQSPSASLLTALLPFTPVLPAIPECAGRQLVEFANTYFVPCLFTIFPESLQVAVREGTSLCPDCPQLVDLYDCSNEFGFKKGSDGIGYLLSMAGLDVNSGFLAAIGTWLQSTCLVRGGCFFGIGQVAGEDRGVLAGIFGAPLGVSMANETGISNTTVAELTLEYCARSVGLIAGLGDLAVLALVIILLFYLWPIFVALVQTFLASFTWLFGSLTSSQPPPMESAELEPVPDGLLLDMLSTQERRLRRIERGGDTDMTTATGNPADGAGNSVS